MKGLMGAQPLTVHAIFERMRTLYADSEVVDATGRNSYGELADRVLRLVTVLRDLGVEPGDRVATFANNSIDHLALYYAAPLAGAVLHTVNIRLHDEQIAYIVNHAEDAVLFVDADLVPRLASVAPDLKTVRHVIGLGGTGEGLDGVLDGDALLDAAVPASALTEVDEWDACALCYTSGTTGMPKGVLYSHRATYLHALSACTVDSLGISESDRILPVVPLFHACGWGMPYIAGLVGADLVFAGADVSPQNLARIIETERVTYAAGVPTIWTGLLPLVQNGSFDYSTLRLLMVGGSATPRPLMQAYDAAGVTILQVWGMTETTPLACASRPRKRHAGLDEAGLLDVRLLTGTLTPGVEGRIVAEDGSLQPWDGVTVGELQVRGPFVATAYYGEDGMSEKFDGDWLRTGDMAAMEPDGYFKIVDRSKDLVKSGGEWISSVELEGAIMSHPLVREAAVVGVRSRKWDERPVAVVALVDGVAPTLEDLHAHLADQVAKWWLPDDIVVVDEIPKTSVGKFDKKVIRAQLAEMELD